MDLPDLEQRETALDITRSFIVQAPAGSGKTELLTRRFVKLLLQGTVDPEEVIAITFTRKAAAEMRHRVLSVLPEHYSPRLRIMTIDAFCAFLCTQMPLRSQLSEHFAVTEEADNLYEQAIQNLCLYHQHSALEEVLLYLDNDFTRVKALFIDILKHRDQWLPHIFGWEVISALEQGLKNLIKEAHTKTLQFISQQDLAVLQAQSENIASLFLTKQGTLRKKLPPGFEYISPDFEAHLKDLQHLPQSHYSTSQKKFILALSTLLPLLVAELQLVFKTVGQYDFIEISLRASSALGEETQPTDLNLRLDYQIKHLLVDEFQDTSISQWRLLQKITAGWESQDGRTLFLVGDPMQSIYRFRKAEVGLFLEVQKYGLSHITLHPLTLSSNFRSSQPLVHWFNHSFATIFPQQSDASTGAIAYSPSYGQALTNDKNTVFIYPVDNQIKSEAQNIIDIIHQYPSESIAILVRSRSHLREIIPVLQQQRILFRAVEITTLADHILIEDLLALTKALLHPADRIAWFAILRAPWCGLRLEDLQKLAVDYTEKTILDNLLSIKKEDCTLESWLRIQHFLSAIQWAMRQRGRLCLREWIEKTWLKLSGPTCLSHPQDLNIAEKYFNLLDEYQNINAIEKQLSRLTLPVETHPDIHVDIMTIHKAKGLEFDVIILPGLEKTTRADASRLFLWTERLNENSHVDLLVAPIRAADEKESQIYEYLKYEESKREAYELQRLLYVACTRAKKFLHLLFSANIKSPASKTFLMQLWPVLSAEIDIETKVKLKKSEVSKQQKEDIVISPIFKRLPLDILDLNKDKKSENSDNIIVIADIQNNPLPAFTLSQLQQRHIGIVVHEVLQHLGKAYAKPLSEKYIRMRLLQLSGTTEGIECIQQCLDNIRQDKRAKWILHPHQDARSEYALTTVRAGEILHAIIDRTFIDEHNHRWIIDYKITLAVAIEKYRVQLEKYAHIFKQMEDRPIHLGLYFPLTCDWIAWEFKEDFVIAKALAPEAIQKRPL